MFAEYILAAMERATYEIIDDPEPYYGEVPELQGVWATGKTLEECRKELQSVIEGWIALKLRLGHPIPVIGGHISTDLLQRILKRAGISREEWFEAS